MRRKVSLVVAVLAGTVGTGSATGRSLCDQVTRALAAAAASGADTECHRNAFERVRTVGDDASHFVIGNGMAHTDEHGSLFRLLAKGYAAKLIIECLHCI